MKQEKTIKRMFRQNLENCGFPQFLRISSSLKLGHFSFFSNSFFRIPAPKLEQLNVLSIRDGHAVADPCGYADDVHRQN